MAAPRFSMTSPATRAVFALMALAGVAIFVAAFVIADPNSDTQDVIVSANPAVDRLIPPAGDEVPRQNRVGIDLAPGFAAELFLNGERIPDDQLDVTTDDVFAFSPGGDKLVRFLDTEENCVRAVYYLIAEPTARNNIEWCFTAG